MSIARIVDTLEALDGVPAHLAVRLHEGGQLVPEHAPAGAVVALERDDDAPTGAQGQQVTCELGHPLAPASGRWRWDERVEATGRHPALS